MVRLQFWAKQVIGFFTLIWAPNKFCTGNGVKLATKVLRILSFRKCWSVMMSGNDSVESRNKRNGVHLIAHVNWGGNFQICGVKDKNGGNEKKEELSKKVNAKTFSYDLGNVIGMDENMMVATEDGSFQNCLRFAAANWSSLVNGFHQVSWAPLKPWRKRFHKMDVEVKSCSCIKLNFLHEVKQNGSNRDFVSTIGERRVSEKQRKPSSFECLVGFINQLPQTLHSLDKGVQENYGFVKAFMNISDWPKVDVNGFIRDLRFAKVGGVPSGVIGPSSPIKEDGDGKRFFEETDRDGDGPSISSEAASVAAIPPTVEITAGSVLRSALAGGLSCAFSCAVMHPVDTIKTQVQASTLSFTEIISMVQRIGAKGLYKGSIPAIFGQLGCHSLRTGIFEASKSIVLNVAPTLPEMQVNSILSFCSTILGTVMRIPSEVVKQRLQAGLYDTMGEAIIGTWRLDGFQGFFRGTGATLCREVPFYVAGMSLYDESKKAVQKLIGRELEPWEAVVVGAISGGLAGVTTTPFDVIKTRMMTTQGQYVSMAIVALSILRHEGPLALYKGAVPRFFWIAPLGAINLAGYELARNALNHLAGEQPSQKRVTSSK